MWTSKNLWLHLTEQESIVASGHAGLYHNSLLGETLFFGLSVYNMSTVFLLILKQNS